ncbi:MAG: DUF1566 domain-containing protein [Treponema sp.]|jgi:hypothetical protein|nr:DUF1566 domain-containing protein [Treponema sp.]
MKTTKTISLTMLLPAALTVLLAFAFPGCGSPPDPASVPRQDRADQSAPGISAPVQQEPQAALVHPEMNIAELQQEPAPQAAPEPKQSPLFEGEGGRDIRLAVGLPEGKNLAAAETWLAEFTQGNLIGDFQKYSAMTVIDRQNLDKIIAEQQLAETGFYSEENYAQIGNLTNAQYILSGTILKMPDKKFSVQLGVADTETGVRKASFTKTCTEEDLKQAVVLRDASFDLLTQMGVSLTEEGKKALYGIQARAVEAETALAQGIAAQKKGTIVEALSYYYNAASFDPSLTEASGRLNMLSAGIAGGNIGQNVRNDIEQRREWLKVLTECAAFFKTHLPWEIVYDPALTEGKVDYQKETAELSFEAVLRPTDGFNVLDTLLEGLEKTGKRKTWGLKEWPLSGEGKVFDIKKNRYGDPQPLEFLLEAALLNDRGRTISTAKVSFTSGLKMEDKDEDKESKPVVYGNGQRQSITFTVKAGDISDKMTVKITRIDGRDAAAAGRSGYMRIAALSSPSYPAPDKEYKIGDTGPAGGIIFHVREDAAPGEWRYLEASPQDLSRANPRIESRIEWGNYDDPGEIEIGVGTGTGTGWGKSNTEYIVKALQKCGETEKAAQLCAGYKLNGYADWFLPSKDELELMYKNLKTKGLGGFSNFSYWSSSEIGSNAAWKQYFSDGSYPSGEGFMSFFKNNSHSVRAVRAF